MKKKSSNKAKEADRSKENGQTELEAQFLEELTPDEFLIVGIGASAGGIMALRSFFENVAADSGMAYVVILHLSPDHDSKLAEVLQVASKIPVTQVTEQVRVLPDHVYVVPPNKSMAMNDGHINLLPLGTVEER